MVITRALLSLLPHPHRACSCSVMRERLFQLRIWAHTIDQLEHGSLASQMMAHNLFLGMSWEGREVLGFCTQVRLDFFGIWEICLIVQRCCEKGGYFTPDALGKWVNIPGNSKSTKRQQDCVTSWAKLRVKMITFASNCFSSFCWGWLRFSNHHHSSTPSPG